MSTRVLVSTHDLERAGELRAALREEGYTVELVTPSEELSTDDAALLVLSDGAEVGREDPLVRQAVMDLDLPVIGYGRSEDGSAPDGVLELFDPTTDPGRVAMTGRIVVERARLQRLTGIVGETETMYEMLERVVQIAPVDSTVLVTGESGTGKELVARGIHALSPRKHEPFIAVNVAALSETLLESELFGHEKGAFTGAVDSRRGLFELADGGTIFLDEIGEMPLSTQTKLLRVLEQREFLRVGGQREIRVDVRIVAATNQDLRRLVPVGDFRRDLYYRLNVLRIELPPLRERADDVPRLVAAFVEEASERHDRPEVEISAEAMEILKAHHWPGNVRELKNLVESMVVLSPGREIRPDDIPPEVRGTSPGRSLVPIGTPPTRAERGAEDSLRPELEFVFRTLVELRMDVDDLRREFESYRESTDARPYGVGRRGEVRVPAGEEVRIVDVPSRPSGSDETPGGSGADRPPSAPAPQAAEGTVEGPAGRGETPEEDAEAAPSGEEGAPEEGAVVFRPGMTMEEMEREAIAAALREVDGNRRKAAEMLGIGERTLYRKIKRYGLEE